jgi:cation-transporting ATPase E
LLVYKGSAATELDKTQAGTTALITLITVAMWVLGIVARPYAPWKIGLIGGMIVLTVLLFVIPFTQDFFALNPTITSYTLIAFACATAGIAVIELAWWFGRDKAR